MFNDPLEDTEIDERPRHNSAIVRYLFNDPLEDTEMPERLTFRQVAGVTCSTIR